MTVRSSIAAMLWELWRVTRVEAAWRLALGLGVSLVALILSALFGPAEIATWEVGASIAEVLLYLPHLAGWISLAVLNGGRPGFPLYLHYTRPIPTAVMVGVPTVYLTTLSFAIYLVSAFLLRATSGYPFSVLPAAAWIAAITVVLRAITWSTRSVAVVTLGSLVTLFVGGGAVGSRLDAFPNDVNYPLTDYAVIALIGLVCFGATVASVTRQRRGDVQAGVTRNPGAGFRGRLMDLVRVPCPTSSATRAQVWLELKTNGLPVLTIGVALAILILLLSAIGNRIDVAFADEIRTRLSCANTDCFFARAWPVILTPFSLLVVLGLGRNAFGIRRRQGRAYLSAFEATQAQGTTQMALLKVLVSSVCVLAAIIAIGVSAWISVRLLGDPVFIQMWNVPLSSQQPAITGAVAAWAGYEQLSLVVVVAVGVVTWVAALAVFGALRIRYSHRVSIAFVGLVLYGLVFLWLAVGVRVDPETASRFHLDVVYRAMGWIATAAMVFTTVHVFWSGFAEHVLTIRYATGAVAISAAFGAAWLTVLHLAGVQPAGVSAVNAISVVSAALLPLMASGLVPWSLSRIRHT
jgi:hypothetical protein